MNTLRRPTLRIWGWSVLAGIALALLGGIQSYTSRRIEGLPADFATLLEREALNWLTWAALAPLVLTLGDSVLSIRASRVRTAFAWVGGGLAILVAHSAIEVALARGLGVIPITMTFATHVLVRFSATLAANLVILGLIALVFNAVRRREEARVRQLREADLQTQLARSQLTVLRMQLQPHFLFNTLHAVSSLMSTDVSAARRMLVRLGELLRSSLSHGDRHEVRLDNELAFLEKYLEIQRMRFEDRLTLDVQVEPAVLPARVPSLLLQPLVENALRHGVERRAGPGFVRIRAFRRGDQLHITVADNGPGLTHGRESRNGSEGGLGLANTRARLERHYGTAQMLELVRAEEGGLEVRVAIPFQELSDGERADAEPVT